MFWNQEQLLKDVAAFLLSCQTSGLGSQDKLKGNPGVHPATFLAHTAPAHCPYGQFDDTEGDPEKAKIDLESIHLHKTNTHDGDQSNEGDEDRAEEHASLPPSPGTRAPRWQRQRAQPQGSLLGLVKEVPEPGCRSRLAPALQRAACRVSHAGKSKIWWLPRAASRPQGPPTALLTPLPAGHPGAQGPQPAPPPQPAFPRSHGLHSRHAGKGSSWAEGAFLAPGSLSPCVAPRGLPFLRHHHRSRPSRWSGVLRGDQAPAHSAARSQAQLRMPSSPGPRLRLERPGEVWGCAGSMGCGSHGLSYSSFSFLGNC
ncbi:IRX1 isoform 1 [Pongo abelii]|uniref:IRX1 isoform 1 n=1 Tax=Pongo abelii TaxID=9601 RepID=A0A2J8R243_PONAB|nr:IRX1 isoform 1 [Pongo abelii]